MDAPYIPVNCEFHDVLEATAVRRQVAAIVHRDAQGHPVTVHARIRDVYARDGAEYLHLDDGRRLRLDAIVSVDGVDAGAFGPACPLDPPGSLD